MAKAALFLTMLLMILASSSSSSASASTDMDTLRLSLWGSTDNAAASCNNDDGGECFDENLDSESGWNQFHLQRRQLGGRFYISYGALSANSIPCSRRGVSYYGCRPGRSVNPYRRFCNRISRCARDTS